MKFKRVLLKLSGEQFGGATGTGIDSDFINALAKEIKELVDETKVELVIMAGGGNFVRGKDMKVKGLQEETAHYMGMMSGMLNGLALVDVLQSMGQVTYAQSKLGIDARIADKFDSKKAIEHLQKGEVVIVLGGTGQPFVTHDTGAVQAATDLGCELVLKATKVDGVYDKDPAKHESAKKFDSLTHAQASEHPEINVMDKEAHDHAHKHELPVIVFDLNSYRNIKRIVQGEKIGTRVTS